MNRLHTAAAVVAIVVFALIGHTVGKADVFDGATFAETLRAFADDFKIRSIFALIVIDIVFGVLASVRVRAFNVKRIADFYATIVMPYIIGYGVFWLCAVWSVNRFAPAVIGLALLALGYGVIMTALIGSIIVNARRAWYGVSDTDTADMSSEPPVAPRG